MKPIFLCGFMGCGKTTLGQLLAHALQIPFYDLDEEIVAQEGMAIPRIFEEKGEAAFRSTEAAVLARLAQNGGVIATGGGALLNPDTARLARSRGRVLFFDVPFEVCYQRIQGDTNRPLAISRTKEQLAALYESRRAVYLQNSTDTVNASGTTQEVLSRLLALCDEALS